MALQRRRQNLVPLRPFREMEDWDRDFEDMFGKPLWPAERWMPAIDVFEKEDRFMVKADLPGMKMEDIDVSVVGNSLVIKGEKKSESEVKEEDYYRAERSYGSFFRSMPFPSDVDVKKIDATYENGVLEVTLPKMAEAKPKKVRVAAQKKEKAAAKETAKEAGK